MKIKAILPALLLVASATAATAQTPYIMQPADGNYSWEADLHHRLLTDYSKTRDQAKE